MKINIFLLLIAVYANVCTAQIIGHPKKYPAWKQGKLYVVKTQIKEVDNVLETAVKLSFQNYAGTISELEAEKLMDNENNFFVTVTSPTGSYDYIEINWSTYGFTIGIYQANAKKFKKTEYYKDVLIHQEFLPIAPNLNVGLFASESRELYKKMDPENKFNATPNVIAMLPSTILNFKRFLDEVEKVEGDKSDKKTTEEISPKISEDAKILTKKTLLILNNSFTEDFYNGYSFKKEKVEPNDLSKLISKNKDYCFLSYTNEFQTFTRQISVIDCETGKVIYTRTSWGSSKMSRMSKEQAQDLNDAVNGKYKTK
jgi:hypothetical protein